MALSGARPCPQLVFTALYLVLLSPAVATRALRNAMQESPSKQPVPGKAGKNQTSVSAGVASSLKLANALAAAVEHMEKGTQMLLSAPNTSQEAVDPLHKILHNLKGLHVLAGELRGRYMSDMVSLQAEVDRQRAAAEVATRESEMLRKDETRLQDGVQGADQMKCNDELQRKTWGFMVRLRDTQRNMTQECALARDKDSQQIENLTQQARSCEVDSDKLNFELERTRVDLRDREKTVAELQSNLHNIEDERNLLILERQNLQQNASATRREWEQDKLYETKLVAEWKDKADDMQEELGDRTEQTKALLSDNINLKKDLEAQKQTIASLQRDLASMSDDKAALLDSMRNFLHGNSMPAARMLAAASMNGSFAGEVSLEKTMQIDNYLRRLQPSPPTTTTTMPHIEARALKDVFGASPPEIVKVVSPPEPTAKPKEALQRFLDINKMPESVPPPVAGVVPPNDRLNTSTGRNVTEAANAVVSTIGVHRAGATQKPAQSPPAGAQSDGTGAHATAAEAKALRERFGEADRALGGFPPLPQEAAPVVPSLHVTEEGVAAAGANAMQDLFSEADRIIFSAVDS